MGRWQLAFIRWGNYRPLIIRGENYIPIDCFAAKMLKKPFQVHCPLYFLNMIHAKQEVLTLSRSDVDPFHGTSLDAVYVVSNVANTLSTFSLRSD